MKAAVVTEQGVQYKDAPKPSPKPNEILIKVRAASLNRADLAALYFPAALVACSPLRYIQDKYLAIQDFTACIQ